MNEAASYSPRSNDETLPFICRLSNQNSSVLAGFFFLGAGVELGARCGEIAVGAAGACTGAVDAAGAATAIGAGAGNSAEAGGGAGCTSAGATMTAEGTGEGLADAVSFKRADPGGGSGVEWPSRRSTKTIATPAIAPITLNAATMSTVCFDPGDRVAPQETAPV
jgi:hypothetical protein